MTKFNSSFCVLPWIHLHINPKGNVLPCCDSLEEEFQAGELNPDKPLETHHSSLMQQLRESMLEGQSISACKNCYVSEEHGVRSARQYFNEIAFPNEAARIFQKKSPEAEEILSIDFRGDNICNFKCRTCCPKNSSAIAAEEREAGNLLSTNRESFALSFLSLFDHVDFSKVRRIYFAGGEPLLARDHYRVLQRLIAEGHTDIEIAYTTNVSRLSHNNYEIFELWKHFPKLLIGLSLDSWGSRAEYIRTGQNWQETETDIKSLQRQLPRATIFPSITISALNALTLPDFIEYLVEKQLSRRGDIHFHLLHAPRAYRIDELGSEFQEHLAEKLDSYIFQLNKSEERTLAEKILSFRSFAESGSGANHSADLIQDCLEKDRRRGTCFRSTFPELSFLGK